MLSRDSIKRVHIRRFGVMFRGSGLHIPPKYAQIWQVPWHDRSICLDTRSRLRQCYRCCGYIRAEIMRASSPERTHTKFETVRVWDSVKIHWLSVNIHGKNGFDTATKLGTTDKIFVAATKRFIGRTKHFDVVTKCFCYPYFNKWFC